MATAGTSDDDDVDRFQREYRQLVGRAIIDGLLSPGAGDILQAYNQTDGGYWQGPGQNHKQGSGDYHQG